MYLIKTKKHFEEQETKELQYKRAKCAERQTIAFDLGRPSAAESGKHPSHLGVEELPDGVCFRPKNVLNTDKSSETAVKSAEYIGSFSVSGTDQNTKAEFVQKQLEGMRDVSKSKRVLLVISLSGIKVCSNDGESVYMAHALRRISFATCDPEFSQFSFIAREPKGNVNLLFCHAFITQSPEEAEEINAIVGNAFKMAYAQEKGKQPTFNELIEQQLKEQKVKFQQYQEEVQKAFQQKLKDIATPTPFSEKAQEHLEMRRQSSSDDSTISDKGEPPGKNKVWAKHLVDKVKHRSPVVEGSTPGVRSESPTRASRPSSENINTNNPRISEILNSGTKRNSTPVTSTFQQVASVFRSSGESSSNKNKGSPVTALKEAIDKGYMTNGKMDAMDTANAHGIQIHDPDGYLQPKTSKDGEKQSSPASMVNRPLPAIPSDSSPSKSSQHMNGRKKHTSPLRNGHSPSKHNYIHTSVDDQVVSVTRRHKDPMSSPNRRPPRPMSEVFDQRHVAGGREFRVDDPGCYMYSRSQLQYTHHNFQSSSSSPFSVPTHGPVKGYRPQGHPVDGGPVLRYQNDSPFQESGSYESPSDDFGPKSKAPGLESLMGLDRSHIEDETLRHSSWYQAGIPREIALEILQQEEIGSFIVRDSSTHPGCYALSVRVPKFENPTGISHYLILKTQRGVKLKGLDKEWPDLLALVTHHTVMSEMLPCTLKLPRKSKNPTYKESEDDRKEEDPDYQRLSDFSSMMAALKN